MDKFYELLDFSLHVLAAFMMMVGLHAIIIHVCRVTFPQLLIARGFKQADGFAELFEKFSKDMDNPENWVDVGCQCSKCNEMRAKKVKLAQEKQQ